MLKAQGSGRLFRRVYAAAALLMLFYFLFWQLNRYLAESLKDGIYLFFAPVLVASALYFRRLRDGIESKLLFAFMVWVVATRMLNGDTVLRREYVFVLDLSLMIPLFSLGFVLDAAGRRRFLYLLSLILGLVYFALGCLALYTILCHRDILNPITGGYLTRIPYTTYFPRLSVLDENANVVGFWYYCPLVLMLYQFFACRNRLWRIPIVLCFLLCFIVIAFSFSRSAMLSVSFCLALAFALLLREKLKGKSRALRAVLCVLVFLCSAALVYKSFGWSSDAIGAVSKRILERPAPAAAEAAQTAAVPSYQPAPLGRKLYETEPLTLILEDKRDYSSSLDTISSGRLEIFVAAFKALRQEPSVLLRGNLNDSLMTITNTFVNLEPYVHYHNYLLHSLMLTGIPGFLLVLAFTFAMLWRSWQLCFSKRAAAPFEQKLLCLPVLGCLLCGQFEAGFFNYTDGRTLFFYLMCGLLAATAAEFCPSKS